MTESAPKRCTFLKKAARCFPYGEEMASKILMFLPMTIGQSTCNLETKQPPQMDHSADTQKSPQDSLGKSGICLP